MKALHISASVMLTILVMLLVFFAVQPTDKPNTCQPDPEVLRLAWQMGANTTLAECSAFMRSGGEFIPNSDDDCWPQDSIEIIQILNGK